ncbi:hypothetical protein [Clostridium saccharoperbutylacetonicum]|nr:hypothetical protein [Clostridium saccharoperbutylacetonicum]AQR94797.1 hypothetical protein CLSAP_21110 [Clostridium saccharoperbutylacetonicum]NSB30638.1 hypothetical protein [Clostridium saccharoperbutylacetonicum]
MDVMVGVLGAIIIIIIGMLFGRIDRIIGLFIEEIVKVFKKLF